MTRQCLPNRRLAETFELEIAGLRYTCTVGRFNDDDNLRDLVPVTSRQDRLIPIMDILGCAAAFQN
jgi:hypothetical protein